MKKITTFAIVILFVSLFVSAKSKPSLKLSNLSYLSYESQFNEDESNVNQFLIKRAYFTLKGDYNEFLSYRITMDAHQDKSGSFGNRLKYVYANFHLGDFLVFTDPGVEFGIVHMPWLDFEEHLNLYRMQGTMFMERAGLFNSADIGFTFSSLLGGKMSEKYQKEVSKYYPGKYGSVAFGLYNGGGYHAAEENENKTFEGRLTLRPLPEVIPGLQFSYFGTFGKGNTSEILKDSSKIPDWQTNCVLVSYQSKYLTLAAQGVKGTGNQKGNMITENLTTAEYEGFSVFAEGKFGDWKIIGRYDSFDPNLDAENDDYTRAIAGVGYDFGDRNVLILDFDRQTFKNDDIDPINALKLTMQIHLGYKIQ